MWLLHLLKDFCLYFKTTYQEEHRKLVEKDNERRERVRRGEIHPFDSLGGGFGSGGGSSDD